MKPAIRIIRVVIMVAEALYFLFMKRYVIRPKNTTAIVACPLGREKPVSGIRALRGRALWKISFRTLIATPVTRIVAAKKMPFFFDIFRYTNAAIIRETIARIVGSRAWAIIFENVVRAGVSIDCISVFVAMSIFMLVVAIEY